jgi:hypothetical protein
MGTEHDFSPRSAIHTHVTAERISLTGPAVTLTGWRPGATTSVNQTTQSARDEIGSDEMK